jgi:hypothetical protein
VAPYTATPPPEATKVILLSMSLLPTTFQEQVVGRKVIGMMHRYMRVWSIKTKHARVPEKNMVPIC